MGCAFAIVVAFEDLFVGPGAWLLQRNNSANFAGANINATAVDSGEDVTSTMSNQEMLANMITYYNENSKLDSIYC